MEDDRSPWEKLPKPAMAQVVIVLSFTTIISLMLATFWVVVQVRDRLEPSPPRSRVRLVPNLASLILSSSFFIRQSLTSISRSSIHPRSQLGGVSFNDS